MPRLAEHSAKRQQAWANIGSSQRILLCSKLLPKHERNLLVWIQRGMAGNLLRLQYYHFVKPVVYFCSSQTYCCYVWSQILQPEQIIGIWLLLFLVFSAIVICITQRVLYILNLNKFWRQCALGQSFFRRDIFYNLFERKRWLFSWKPSEGGYKCLQGICQL